MIIVYGRADCKKCEAFKEKLAILNVEYTYYDCADLQKEWEAGNKHEATRAMSALQLLGGEMPAVYIRGSVYRYAEAIKEIRRTL